MEESGKLVVSADTTVLPGKTVFMHDSKGYHRVGGDGKNSITMHLYSPEYLKCRVFESEDDINKVHISGSSYTTIDTDELAPSAI